MCKVLMNYTKQFLRKFEIEKEEGQQQQQQQQHPLSRVSYRAAPKSLLINNLRNYRHILDLLNDVAKAKYPNFEQLVTLPHQLTHVS